jgi:DNA-binding MarR family transcriptional regulator
MASRSSLQDLARFRTQLMNLSRRLRREGQKDDRSYARLLLLGAIERAGGTATPTQLAGAESMRSSNMAAALRDLESDGLIVRAPDTEDRRKVWVRLTKSGQKAVLDYRDSLVRWLAEAAEHCLTDDERVRLVDAGELLERIALYSAQPRPLEPRSRSTHSA